MCQRFRISVEVQFGSRSSQLVYAVCPRSSYQIYVVTFNNYIKWVITSWTDGILKASDFDYWDLFAIPSDNQRCNLISFLFLAQISDFVLHILTMSLRMVTEWAGRNSTYTTNTSHTGSGLGKLRVASSAKPLSDSTARIHN